MRAPCVPQAGVSRDRGADQTKLDFDLESRSIELGRGPNFAWYAFKMTDRYRLNGLADDQLLTALSGLVKRENDSLSDLLAHLAELEERGLCLALGYSSLFAYCTEALGFCKSSAGRRIAAARLCRQYPEAFVRVAKGELQLSVLCLLRPHLNADNAAELFDACRRKSYEQVDELLAARFPKPDVRDLIRRFPVPTERAPDMGSKSDAPSPAQGSDSSDVRPAPVPPSREPVPQSVRPGQVKPLATDRFSVHFTADAEFRELLEEVRVLLSHAQPKCDLHVVMKRGLESLRTELLKKRFAVGRKPRLPRASIAHANGEEATASKQTRCVPAAVTREVYTRDEGRCTFCADDGRRCAERRLLQLDHVIPHAAGGEPTVENLRLRCRAHNLHTARLYFGAEYVRARVEQTREARRRGRELRHAGPSSPGTSISA